VLAEIDTPELDQDIDQARAVWLKPKPLSFKRTRTGSVEDQRSGTEKLVAAGSMRTRLDQRKGQAASTRRT